MKRAVKPEKWASEAAMCAEFIAYAERKKKWRAYPETAGWDILMVRVEDGLQVGIEAKLALNVKVLEQALGTSRYYLPNGPDLRAVLVPRMDTGGLSGIARALGITVICFEPFDRTVHGSNAQARPDLPTDDWSLEYNWHPWAPQQRETLPEYIPDVTAGSSAPVTLSSWKVKAIKLAILLETRPVTRSDFKALQIDATRWTNRDFGWLDRGTHGSSGLQGYVAGPRTPDFRAQHPRNYEEIKADFAKWAPPYQAAVPLPALSEQGTLL